MARKQAKKPVKAKGMTLTIRIDPTDIYSIKTIESLKTKLNCKSATKALLEAARKFDANDYEKDIRELKFKLTQISVNYNSFMNSYADLDRIKESLQKHIKEHQPAVKKLIESQRSFAHASGDFSGLENDDDDDTDVYDNSDDEDDN